MIAGFFRIFGLEPFGWVPDQYDRLIEAEEMLQGHLPDSLIYPPGGSVIILPAVAIFGSSIGTMQAVAIALSIALVPVAYALVIRTTGDRLAATLLASACAITPAFILPARSGYVDSAATLLIAVAFLMLPTLKGRSVVAFVMYGLMLSLLFNIRPTNAFVVPSLAVYWIAILVPRWTPLDVLKASISKGTVAAGAAFALPSLGSMLLGNWYGGAYGGLVAFDDCLDNLTWYWGYLVPWIGAPFLVPLAALGVLRLWKDNRPLTLALGSLLIIWPVVHSPFLFVSGRYMLPSMLALFFFCSVGFSGLMADREGQRAGVLWKPVRAWAVVSLAVLASLFVFAAGIIASDWKRMAAESDAGLAGEFRPILEQLPAGTLVVTSVSRAFVQEDFPLQYVDLFDQSVAYLNRDEGVAATVAAVQAKLGQGDQVYYLYSHMDTDMRNIGGIWDYFGRYYQGLDAEFEMTEVFRAVHERGGIEPWILYRIAFEPPLDAENQTTQTP